MFDRGSSRNEAFLAPWTNRSSGKRLCEAVTEDLTFDKQEEESPYVKRKFRNPYKKIDVEKIKEDPMSPYNPDYVSRSIDIDRLHHKLNKLKPLPNITRTRTDKLLALK